MTDRETAYAFVCIFACLLSVRRDSLPGGVSTDLTGREGRREG